MSLLDKRSIAVEGVRDFTWSPTDPFICFWTPEVGNTPARLTLMEIPSRRVLRTKNIFNVNDVSLQTLFVDAAYSLRDVVQTVLAECGRLSLR